MKIVSNVGGNLDNIKRLEREVANMLLAAKLEEIQKALRGKLLPFKKYSKVDEFLAQYKEVRSRYKFLVLEGQSKTGKTCFTKWLLGNPDRVFETNCAACPEPELRDFNSLYHETFSLPTPISTNLCFLRRKGGANYIQNTRWPPRRSRIISVFVLRKEGGPTKLPLLRPPPLLQN